MERNPIIISLLVAVLIGTGVILSSLQYWQPTADEEWHALYLHCRFPTHGQFYYSTAHDIGSLLVEPPETEGIRYCSQWVMFDYDVENEAYHYQDINDIYFHIWFDSSGAAMGEAGYRNDVANWVERYGFFEMDNSVSIVENIVATVGDYRLFTTIIDVGVTEKENVYDFGVVVWKIREMGSGNQPSVVSGPERTSFVIFNLKSDSELLEMDTDSDGLSDYYELYTIYTNPFAEDTDSDGVLDSDDDYPNLHTRD